jgi:hypothetical protein
MSSVRCVTTHTHIISFDIPDDESCFDAKRKFGFWKAAVESVWFVDV